MFSGKKNRSFKIYALIHNGRVFVGKTQGEIDPVYYRHCRAENPYTTQYFFPKNSKTATIHILECIICSSQESYRHIVAWVSIFQDVGYKILNPQGTVEDANDLHPKTKDLLYRLRPISLETFLKETQHQKQSNFPPPTSNSLEKNQNNASESRQKITLWMTPEDKEYFVLYAKSLRLTQAQTLRYLIHLTHLEEADSPFQNRNHDTFIHFLQQSHAQEIEAKDEKIHNLQIALRACVDKQSWQRKKNEPVLRYCAQITGRNV